jgi:hypothetical protein
MPALLQQHHKLDYAGSPLVRALPEFQRQFEQHLQQGSAIAEASQRRCVFAGGS